MLHGSATSRLVVREFGLKATTATTAARDVKDARFVCNTGDASRGGHPPGVQNGLLAAASGCTHDLPVWAISLAAVGLFRPRPPRTQRRGARGGPSTREGYRRRRCNHCCRSARRGRRPCSISKCTL